MEIIRETEEYLLVRKAAGENSEKDMPEGALCIHRLDKAASGLLIYGKTKAAAAELSRELQDKQITKTYRIVISGKPEAEEGELKDLLYKDSRKQKMFPVKRKRAGVKEAKLRYKLLETVRVGRENVAKKGAFIEYSSDNKEIEKSSERAEKRTYSLVEVELETGRFHQIRAQFAARGLPLVGDSKYGSRAKAKHIALCCNFLSFLEPKSGKEVRESIELPSEFPWTLFSGDAEK